MYTRCPDCETTFRLGAEDLRRAQGKVRCGDCGNVFNALEFIAEDAENTDASLPVLTTGPTIISSADNPHRDEPLFEPADEMEAPETFANTPGHESDNIGYELEINAPVEKTGETWSPLDTSSWDTESAPVSEPIALGDDASDWETAPEEVVSIEADTKPEYTDAALTVEVESPATANESSTDTETELSDFYSDDSPIASPENLAAEEKPKLGAPAWLDDEYDAIDDLDMDLATNIETDVRPENEHTALKPETTPSAEPIQPIENDAEDDLADVLLQDSSLAATEDDTASVDAEADPEHFAENAPDFDDCGWERIPGVGAAQEYEPTPLADEKPEDPPEDLLADGLSYTGTNFLAIDASVIDEPNDDTSDEAVESETNAVDAAQDDKLDFDDPENKWSSFFGSESMPTNSISTEQDDDGNDCVEATADESYVADEDEPLDAPLGEVENVDPQATGGLVEKITAMFSTNSSIDVSDNDPESPAELTTEGSAQDSDQDETETQKDFPEPPDDRTTQHWSEMEPIDEVVLSTGEFSIAKIASSLASSNNSAEPVYTENSNPDGWRPAHWTPENPEQQMDTSGESPAWLSGQIMLRQSTKLTPRTKRWLSVASIVLLIGFSAQLLHYNRDRLAAHPSYGSTVRNVYAGLGLKLYPNWSMDSYEIRGSEAIAGESGQDVLDIRTQIASVIDLAVGLPQLRVILQDRWSNPVAARNFGPEEYADKDALPANGMLQPNQTIAAHVAIVDPGSGTQGFELELCIPRRNTGLDCTGQPFR